MEGIHSMKEPVRRECNLQRKKREPLPVIDISCVELPEQVTHRINAGSILGAAAFLDLFVLIPGTVENNPLLTVALILLFWVCVHQAMREEGRRRD